MFGVECAKFTSYAKFTPQAWIASSFFFFTIPPNPSKSTYILLLYVFVNYIFATFPNIKQNSKSLFKGHQIAYSPRPDLETWQPIGLMGGPVAQPVGPTCCLVQ